MKQTLTSTRHLLGILHFEINTQKGRLKLIFNTFWFNGYIFICIWDPGSYLALCAEKALIICAQIFNNIEKLFIYFITP